MKKPPILYPFFFAAYAVIGVYTNNLSEVHIRWMIRPLVVILLLTLFIYVISNLILKNSLRAGWITALVLLWVFFGHIQRLLYEAGRLAAHPGRSVLLLLAWSCLLILLGSPAFWRQIRKPRRLTNYLNMTSVILIIFPVYMTITFWGQIFQQTQILSQNRTQLDLTLLEPTSPPPDIYLIILDAYGRADYLNDVFGYDNTEFIDFLKEKGFYVAPLSSPNYPQTQLSLTSSLNLVYLHDLTRGLEGFSNRAPLYELFQTNKVTKSLKELGYKIVGLPSVILFTRLQTADVYFPMTVIDLNSFEELILSTTVAGPIRHTGKLDHLVPGYDTHRNYINFELETLKATSVIPGPKFVFAHFMAPHPPFIFDQFGNAVQPNYPYTLGDASGFPGTDNEYITGYQGQITYLNHAMMDVISTIMEESERPPIIIIQGDHGPGGFFTNKGLANETCLWERYSILNAYYLPDQQYDLLYPTITPVNTFRVIFNKYFSANLPLLLDRNFYAAWNAPYDFTEITGMIQSTCSPRDVGQLE
jgi:hypothetical protein